MKPSSTAAIAPNVGARALVSVVLVATLALLGCGSDPTTGTAQPDDLSTGLTVDVTPNDVAYPAEVEGNTADIALVCPGASGCACDPTGGDPSLSCNSGLCVVTADGPLCAAACEQNCPAGFACTLLQSGADSAKYCMPKFVHLCDPCESDASCAGPGVVSPLCISHSNDGHFCGAGCTTAGDCPAGYACSDAKGLAGQSAKQCVREFGDCPCSVQAETAYTTCTAPSVNAVGKPLQCKGTRACVAGKLTACDAPKPATEVCGDGIDNDCDGAIDGADACDDHNECTVDLCSASGKGGSCSHQPLDDTPCSDGSACTTGEVCSKGQCQFGKPTDCKSTNLCKAGSCDPVTGACVVKDFVLTPCEDGNPCTMGDTCSKGSCQPGVVNSCPSSGPCVKGVCKLADGKCEFLSVSNGTPCDDDNPCTVSTACSGSVCEGGTKLACDDKKPCAVGVCKVAIGCEYTAFAGPCDDGDDCTKQDSCANSVCVGTGKTAADCTDGNPCTTDACVPGKGCMHNSVEGPCDDGEPCTKADYCGGGVCKPGGNDCACSDPDKPCPDDKNPCNGELYCTAGKCLTKPSSIVACASTGKPCEINACNPATGACSVSNVGDGKSCDDGNACTFGDACKSGACAPGPVTTPCDDSQDCTLDACNSDKGCSHQAKVGPCDDGDACTSGDVCSNGTCAGTAVAAAKCNDSNPCTTDACDVAEGCVHLPNKLPCDDGVACNGEDACAGGICVKGKGFCTCVDDAGCPDDGNLCNGKPSCVANSCVVNPNSAIACDGSINTECAQNQCDPVLGKCVQKWLADGKPCDADGSACTNGDACTGGKCVPGKALDCNDGNPCTADSCDGKLGCNHAASSGSCDDGNPCTQGDACKAGGCLPGNAKDCSDGGDCTTDSCAPDSGQCKHTPNSAACSDGNACTAGDSCGGGLCQAGATIGCDDKNPCTVDTCDPAKGCVFATTTAPCDDASACTKGDTCKAGACQPGATINCDDANPCTSDACDAGKGCAHVAAPGPCDDGNACSKNDACTGATCVGTGLVCDDGNACTSDGCDGSGSGCVSSANVKPCDDGNACTEGDVCKNSACLSGASESCDDGIACTQDSCLPATGCKSAATSKLCDDNNACTDDVCSVATGKCTYAYNTANCIDGSACTFGDACKGGLCQSGGKTDCDDGNGCTDDACDPATGCSHANNSTVCSDGDACTTSDKCQTAKCVGGAVLNCDDKNTCTADACSKTTGCTHVAQGGACDDGNSCTSNDVCGSGLCAGTGLTCDDQNPCTDNGCDASGTGCAYLANSKPCDDANACTDNDLCANKACKPGLAKVCGDGNVCTDDTCDTASGCKYPANTALCNDGDVCTTADQCGGGKCVPGGKKVCTDNNVCTLDACDAVTGCKFSATSGGCDDGNACTLSDQCSGGTCQPGVAKDCSGSGDTCNIGICQAGSCAKQPKTAPCDDGNPCTLGDQCSGGACQAGSAKDCSGSSDACNNGVCSGGSCIKQAKSGSCSDGNGCTVSDFCSGGICKSGTAMDCSGFGDACNTGVCSGGSCGKQAKSGSCDDGNYCTSSDQCSGGQCSGQAKADLTNCGSSQECHSAVCKTCGGAYQPCCGNTTCAGGNLCVSGTCQPEPSSTVQRRTINCKSQHWQAPDDCYPGQTADTGCSSNGCPKIYNYCAATCWKKESGFTSYNSQPSFGSFFLIHHCFEGGGNKYSKSGCSTSGYPATNGYVASSPVAIWNKPLYLCQWLASGITEHFFALAASECSAVGGSLVGGGVWAYVP